MWTPVSPNPLKQQWLAAGCALLMLALPLVQGLSPQADASKPSAKAATAPVLPAYLGGAPVSSTHRIAPPPSLQIEPPEPRAINAIARGPQGAMVGRQAQQVASVRSVPGGGGYHAMAEDGYAFQQTADPMPAQDPAYTAPDAMPGYDADDSVPGSLQGAVTQLKVTRGRSQIVKFAQPISRLSIADPTLADIVPLSPDQLMINGRTRGVTSLIVWDENGQEGIFDLMVENDTSQLMDAIAAISPNENIQVRITDDSFIISGQVSSSVILDEIRRTADAYGFRQDRFVDLTETPVPQVALEVKIVSLNRSISREFRTGFATENDQFAITRLAAPLEAQALVALGTRATPGFAPGLNLTGQTINAGTTRALDRGLRFLQSDSSVGGISSILRLGDLDLVFSALESRGLGSILAEPRLVATHGRSASFLAGGEFPFVSGTDQNGSPIISFREFGVSLDFTPWVNIRSGMVEMTITPEVSSPDPSSGVTDAQGNITPGLLRRTTTTTVQLKDGETLMISGIINQTENKAFSQTPFIGQLPIIGLLFKNTAPDYSKSKEELVVVVTPHILNRERHTGQYFERDESKVR